MDCLFTVNRFPKDPHLRDIWKKFCNNRLTWTPTRNSVICSNHFNTSDFQVLANNRRKLVEGAKPTLTPHCVCPSHQQPSTLADDRLSSYDDTSATLTIPDSLTSACTSSTPQNAQSKETSKIYSSIPTVVLTLRKRKMQEKINSQRKKIKRLQAKILYLKKKVAGLEEILQSLNEKPLIDEE
ncbi:THAP domain-containing protein 1-like isoform X2 [Melitaea cinxia]|uniref:THAP domain-containing protein 1-like isoform X2 n=1 Tax=Melitaea cinxia TaxID=113334 RepID=UPI001E2733B5|nr:THAP domain-containing protein 1-like isoform X2 [Melitaea cinxia]